MGLTVGLDGRRTGGRRMRRVGAVLGAVAAPLVIASTIGAGAADAQPWKLGPLYRSEFSGESAEYLCNKALLLEKAWGATVLQPCTYDPAEGVWARVMWSTTAGFGSSF